MCVVWQQWLSFFCQFLFSRYFVFGLFFGSSFSFPVFVVFFFIFLGIPPFFSSFFGHMGGNRMMAWEGEGLVILWFFGLFGWGVVGAVVGIVGGCIVGGEEEEEGEEE